MPPVENAVIVVNCTCDCHKPKLKPGELPLDYVKQDGRRRIPIFGPSDPNNPRHIDDEKIVMVWDRALDVIKTMGLYDDWVFWQDYGLKEFEPRWEHEKQTEMRRVLGSILTENSLCANSLQRIKQWEDETNQKRTIEIQKLVRKTMKDFVNSTCVEYL